MTASYEQTQYYNLPQPSMSLYRRTTQPAAGQLSDEDDRILRTSVASGASYQDIKDFMFGNRFDLSPQILENRAREIGAEWSDLENLALLDLLKPPFETNDDDLAPVQASLQANLQAQGLSTPFRTIADIRERIIHLMDVGEDYNLRNPPASGSPRGSQEHVSSGEPYIPAYPTVNSDSQTLYTSSPQAVTVSQSPAGPSARPAQNFDDRWKAPEPFPPRPKKHRGKKAIKHEEVQEFKGQIAEGLTFVAIAAESDPPRRPAAIRSVMVRRGWSPWSQEQDNHLLELQKEYGNNMTQIRDRLVGPKRDVDELQKRLKFLTTPDDEQKQKRRSRPHDYSIADDEYIFIEMARGKMPTEIARERFSHMARSNIRSHARMINAMWYEGDNQKLRDKVLEYQDHGYDPDWESIGKQWSPARPDYAVRTRWEVLRGTYRDAG